MLRIAAVPLLLAALAAARACNPDRDITVHRDIPYASVPGVDPNLLSLDVYAPPGAEAWPVMVMIHGGGWRIGDKSNRAVGMDKARYFTGQGYVYVSINYRLSPEVIHPVHVQDVASALAFVHGHLSEYGGDPERIFVMGHSAGAHLAALVATDERRLADEGVSTEIIRGVVLLDGAGYDIPLNLELSGPRLHAIYEQAFTTDAQVQTDASPFTHVNSSRAYPPFLILHVAQREASRIESELLGTALVNVGSEATVIPAAGKTHATINRDIGRPGDVPTQHIMDFLSAHR